MQGGRQHERRPAAIGQVEVKGGRLVVASVVTALSFPPPLCCMAWWGAAIAAAARTPGVCVCVGGVGWGGAWVFGCGLVNVATAAATQTPYACVL